MGNVAKVGKFVMKPIVIDSDNKDVSVLLLVNMVSGIYSFMLYVNDEIQDEREISTDKVFDFIADGLAGWVNETLQEEFYAHDFIPVNN